MGDKGKDITHSMAKLNELEDRLGSVVSALSDSSFRAFKELFGSVGLLIARGYDDSDVPRRMEANAFTAYCFRNQVAFEEAHGADELNDEWVKEIMLEASWRVDGWLQLKDTLLSGGLPDIWNAMVRGYHLFACNRWSLEGRGQADAASDKS